MTEQKNDRTETARRNDDSAMIESIEPTPDQGGRTGGSLQRDIGTHAEEEHFVAGKTGVTRVRKDDERNQAGS